MNATVKTVLLAPPAPVGPVARPQKAREAVRRSKTTPGTSSATSTSSTRGGTRSSWSALSWLSPKINPNPRQRPRPRSDNEDDDGDGSSPGRPRRASFDHGVTKNRLNKERGGESYFKNSSLFGGAGTRRSETSSSAYGYFGPLGASPSKSSDSEDVSLIATSRSADDTIDGVGGGSPQKHASSAPTNGNSSSSSHAHSLLTAFLLQLNSLLPEYCEHLVEASDTLYCINGASKAVRVLERGAKTLSTSFGAAATAGTHAASPQSSSPMGAHLAHHASLLHPSSKARGDNNSTVATSAPTSPAGQKSTSPIKTSFAAHFLMSPPKSDSATSNSSPSKLTPGITHWLYPLSPRGGDSSQDRGARNRAKLSPKRRAQLKQQKSGAKWNAIAESEWERFVAPFLNLAGAECFYARMEHVLDPKRSLSGEENTAKDLQQDAKMDKKGGTSNVQFAATQQSGQTEKENAGGSFFVQPGDGEGGPSVSSVSPTDANKRGSRRLISMYRQVREDLIIVGEYLCDPVLGARAGGSSPGGKGMPKQRLPPPPLNLDPKSSSASVEPPSRLTSRTSPEKNTSASRSLKPSGNETDNNKRTAHEQRESAAISLRNTLDALISFIDARCVLIRIHSELCCPSHQPHPISPVDVRDGNGNHLSDCHAGKWTALADQCRSVMKPISAWAKEEGCVAKHVVSNNEQELKALGLALMSINYLIECNLFNCVVNVRKLHVLLGKATYQSLPIMYIRSSLHGLLAMMHIYFSDASAGLQMLRQFPPLQSLQAGGLSSNRRSFNKLEGDSSKSPSVRFKPPDLNSLFTEFIGRVTTTNSLPLALAVVHRTGGTKDSQPDVKQEEGQEDIEQTESTLSWEPLYIKSTMNNGSAVSDGRNRHGDTYDSIFKRQSHGNNLVRIIKENFSSDRDMGTSETKVKHTNGGGRISKGPVWPFDHWAEIENVLSEHTTIAKSVDPTMKPTIHSVDVRASAGNNDNGKIRRRLSTGKQSQDMSHCHIASISNSICFIAIQGVGHTKRHKVSDDEIKQFMQEIIPKLCPESLLSIKVVMSLKSEIFHAVESRQKDQSKVSTTSSHDNKNAPGTTSLWSESGWSDAQRKKILQSLGLRGKNSPVMAPLKSPYVKRQISGKRGRQRKKKMKNSMNHGHLDFFLGPELSQLL